MVSPYEAQVATLTAFYAKVGEAKDEAACRAIVDKRRAAAASLTEADFSKLCKKLQDKYNQDPFAVYKASLEAAAAPKSGGSEEKGAASLPAEEIAESEAERSFKRQVDTLTAFYSKYCESQYKCQLFRIVLLKMQKERRIAPE